MSELFPVSEVEAKPRSRMWNDDRKFVYWKSRELEEAAGKMVKARMDAVREHKARISESMEAIINLAAEVDPVHEGIRQRNSTRFGHWLSHFAPDVEREELSSLISLHKRTTRRGMHFSWQFRLMGLYEPKDKPKERRPAKKKSWLGRWMECQRALYATIRDAEEDAPIDPDILKEDIEIHFAPFFRRVRDLTKK